MISFFQDPILWISTSIVVLVLLAAVSVACFAIVFFRVVVWPVSPFVRVLGVIALGACCWIFGVRYMDDREAHRHALQEKDNQIARLNENLNDQKSVAEFAKVQRDLTEQERGRLSKEIADYEQKLQEKDDELRRKNPGAPAGANACNLDDADLRALSRLRNAKGRR